MSIDLIPTGEQTPVPEHPCPCCNAMLSAVTATELNPEHLPEPGATTICLHCGAILVLDDQLRPRKPTEQELADLLMSDHAAYVLEMSARFRSAKAAFVLGRPKPKIQ